MEELKKKLLEEFKTEVQNIIVGKKTSYYTILSIGDVEGYLNSIGEVSEDLDTNGWQWDWWLSCNIDGEEYLLSGSGYYGGLTFGKE